LRQELDQLNSMLIDAGEDSLELRRTSERVAIARWLRAEFSCEPPEDTATLALFPVESHAHAKR